MQEDAIFVRQTLEGNKNAFHQLVKKYQPAIYALILSRIKNREDAQDLTQEVFLEAYRDLLSLRQHERFYSWIHQIAEYHCQEWIRRKHIDYSPIQEELSIQSPSADESLLMQEAIEKVIQAVDALPSPDKEILKARYLDNVSYAELQEKYGLSYKGVTNRILRAKQKIREKLRKSFLGITAVHWQDLIENLWIKEGVWVMKLSIKAKIITIGIVVLLSGTGVLIWHLHQPTQEISDYIGTQVVQEPSQKSHSNLLSTKKDTPKVHISDISDKQKQQEKVQTEEVPFQTSSNENQVKDKTQSESKSLNPVAGETKAISPEVQKKAELYSELALILPEYKRLWPHLLNIPAGDKNRSDEESELFKRSYELDMKIVKMCDSFLRPPAIVKDEKGVVQQMNIAPMFIQIAEYLGKELPFDGSPDYFVAEDYKGGTGGW